MSLSATACLDVVQSTLRDHSMLSGDTPVLVAVSGGPDSVALAHILSELRVPIHLAHFDHQTRGGASAEDAAFVQNLAQQLGALHYSTSRDIETEAADSPMSFEEYAREARYAFLVRTARASNCGAIATGHHVDDQAETVLMRVLRGTSPRGLAGIPATGERDDVPIIRPLFRLTRNDIMGYLQARGHAYCHDESNHDIGFARNRVRHELLPQLRHEYNPRVREALCRLADAQRAEDDLVQSLTDEFVEQVLSMGQLDRELFREGHTALKRRTVLEAAWSEGVEPDFDHVERAVAFIEEAAAGKYFDLGGGVWLRAGTAAVEILPVEPEPIEDGETELIVPGTTDAFGKRIRVSALAGPPDEPLTSYCTPTRQVVDAKVLEGEVSVRHRRPGDRIAPYGLGGSRKLKDYFCDLGITPAERDRKLLVTANGKIIWIVGHAVSSEAVVTEATKLMFQIEVSDAVE